jgi:nucleotide-binding universal stress UspA family protein
MSTIIVGVDGSETAAQAARSAAILAVALGADLHVVSAFSHYEEKVYDVGPGEHYVVSTRDSAEALAQDVVKELRGDYPDLKIVAEAEAGKPADALVAAAELTQAELIVIGNKRVQGVSRIMGSVAVDVVRKAPCDVYIAHTHPR